MLEDPRKLIGGSLSSGLEHETRAGNCHTMTYLSSLAGEIYAGMPYKQTLQLSSALASNQKVLHTV
jgi:hypothetical protein